MSIKKNLFFVPSLISLCSLLCGLWSMFVIINDKNIVVSLCLIAVAGILDGMDGRVARFLEVNSNFGVEIDSIIDFLSFGIAPMIIYYKYFDWNNDINAFSILTIFSVCMCVRLAIFNCKTLIKRELTQKEQQIEKLRKNFFFGLAAPIGAMALLFPIILEVKGIIDINCQNCALLYALIISLFLIIPIPIFGIKTFHFGFKKKKDLFFTLFIITFFALFIFNPIKTIISYSILYALTIPFSSISYLYLKNRIMKQN